jgi:hypothetical protein
MVGDDTEKVAVDLSDHCVLGITQMSCACRDICEHAVQMHWRS